MFESSSAVTADPEQHLPEQAANSQYAELAELAGGFIHEIKNHLGTLGLNLQLLAEDFQDAQSQNERRALARVHRLQALCQQLTDISNDFLRFARIRDLQLTPCSLASIIEELIDFFSPTARAANIEIKSFVTVDLPLVELDVDLFKQAILNLMLNAEQAMPEGGQLTLQAAVMDAPVCGNHLSPSSSSEKWLVLHLIDTGKGMSQEVQQRIFQPFFSTKQGGNGLGLPTCKRIIEAHGGVITVESELNRGTRFTICLPVSTYLHPSQQASISAG